MKAYQLDILNFLIDEVNCFQDEFGDYLIPGGCVTKNPPEIKENQCLYWNQEFKTWEIKPDFSGKPYYSKINKKERFFYRGDDFDNDYTDLMPPPEVYIVWKNNSWEVDEILKSKYLKNLCKDEAKSKIALSDWSVLPDVKISNKSDFESYRSVLRNYILTPVENPVFPTEPNPIWITQTQTGDNNG